ncbi:hypothetical protein FB451DRAFT_1178101 [Mycena latifolia]|nr:hypothetical protein FB451DRAFT_1178101 [Mycena latifolia]
MDQIGVRKEEEVRRQIGIAAIIAAPRGSSLSPVASQVKSRLFSPPERFHADKPLKSLSLSLPLALLNPPATRMSASEKHEERSKSPGGFGSHCTMTLDSRMCVVDPRGSYLASGDPDPDIDIYYAIANPPPSSL